MEINVTIDKFEGPLDLLLHLIKQSDIDIYDVEISVITNQYMDYINAMEKMNLNIASEYLIMAAELMEIKSSSLLPSKNDVVDDYEEDKREELIRRLVEYQKYKDMTHEFHELEEKRKMILTKSPSNLSQYKDNEKTEGMDVSFLLDAFQEFLKRKEDEKPIHTKITKKEYSISERSDEIKKILHNKKRVSFIDLFSIRTRPYVVVTFLAVLNLARRSEIMIKQANNFDEILIEEV